MCKGVDSDIGDTGGEDWIEIDEPLLHKHKDTMAETLTGSLAKNFGGGQLMGDFTVGSRDLVTQGKGYGPSQGEKLTPLEHVAQ